MQWLKGLGEARLPEAWSVENHKSKAGGKTRSETTSVKEWALTTSGFARKLRTGERGDKEVMSEILGRFPGQPAWVEGVVPRGRTAAEKPSLGDWLWGAQMKVGVKSPKGKCTKTSVGAGPSEASESMNKKTERAVTLSCNETEWRSVSTVGAELCMEWLG